MSANAPLCNDTLVSPDDLVEPAIALVASWLTRATELETARDRRAMQQLGDLVEDEAGVAFVMQFIDRVARPDDARVAAAQLNKLVAQAALPDFLSAIDRVLLMAGARLAPLLPKLVIPIAKRRMRSLVGHLVADAEPAALAEHLAGQREGGYVLNVNLLGETVLGESEADARLARLKELIAMPDVDYVSVKITSVASQINHWDPENSLARIVDRLADMVDTAAAASTRTFINFDMEEYHDLHLTVEAFKQVLSDPGRAHLDAGIVLQAYLPEAYELLKDLTEWSNDRHARSGGMVKIRLVKGANLAMERVESAIHGWPQAPFETKLESDASFRKCVEWALTPERLTGTQIGLASHNLFDVAWAKLLADHRCVAGSVQFEMLQGMASGQAKAVNEATTSENTSSMLMYTPVVRDDDFDVAIGYLFRRLEENAAPDNFMRKLFALDPGSRAFDDEAEFFRRGVALRTELDHSPRRSQDRSRPIESWSVGQRFVNEPDTDVTTAGNRAWIAEAVARRQVQCSTAITTSAADISQRIEAGRVAQASWWSRAPAERGKILHRVGDELGARRAELIATMMHEASKTLSQADVEVSEAIDFAHWYADRGAELDAKDGASFEPFGLIAVIPPWNFPVAIPTGGVLASLAAGNGVIFKPAPETPRCAEVVAEACWAAGVPADVLQFVRVPDNEVGQLIVESVDAVILTGSSETAALFQSWDPQLRLFAETSGKNALIITPSADLDLAAQDLVESAFGHAGQKCSAASLAILVGDVYESERFRRQLIDAVESLTVGPSTDRATDIAPLVGGVNDRLERAVNVLDGGESWLVRPVIDLDGTMTPGVRAGVRPGSWFHRTECFGPVLRLMAAANLNEAIDIANSSDFGLTGGIHSLDPSEVQMWSDRIEIGNGYVNRPITGAIVQRQPFGGWKKSSVGPGAKAGGVNYVAQLGTWRPTEQGPDDYANAWANHFAAEHDDTALFCEANVFRYRPLAAVGLLTAPSASQLDISRVEKAASICGVQLIAGPASNEIGTWLQELAAKNVERVRVIGYEVTDEIATVANRLNIRLGTELVTPDGRIELQHYVREQALSITRHRFGNLVNAGSGPTTRQHRWAQP